MNRTFLVLVGAGLVSAALQGCFLLDPGTDSDDTDASDTDTDTDTPPPTPPEGFTTGRVLLQGGEILLVGDPGYALDLPGYDIISATISGDGEVVWVSAYNEFASAGPTYKVYSMRSNGTDVQESALVRPSDAPYFPGGFVVQTTFDGQVGFLTQYTYDTDGVVAQFERAARGEAFSVLGTSDASVDPLGLAEDVYLRPTRDGDAVLFTTGRHLWRASESDGWNPFVVDQIENFTWEGEDLPGNSFFRGLDISASGGEYISSVWTGEGNRDVFVTGTSVATYTYELDFESGAKTTAEIDDAGESCAFTGYPLTSYVGPQGGTYSAVTADVGAVADVALADGGQVFHATVREAGVQAPFFAPVPDGTRTASMSPTWTTFGSVPDIRGQLSDDGSIFLSAAPGPIAVHRDTSPAGATVDAVFWRMQDGELTIRAEVSAEQEVQSVTVMPLLDRWFPPRLQYGFEDDPLNSIRFGLELLPLEGESGVYEASVTPREEATLDIDERWSFRVTVNQAAPGSSDVTSTGFLDFDLFE